MVTIPFSQIFGRSDMVFRWATILTVPTLVLTAEGNYSLSGLATS